VLDRFGVAWVAGKTDSGDFPTTAGSWDTSANGGYDAFITAVAWADTRPPVGSLTINADESATNSAQVELSLSASDVGTGVKQMRFGHDGENWTEWEDYALLKPWTLEEIEGTRAVYAQFRDYQDNVSETGSDSIVLDTVSPVGSVSIDSGAEFTNVETVTLSLSAEDGGTAVTHMRIGSDGVTWTDWEPFASSREWNTGNGEGTKLVYAQFKDAAGNISQPCQDTIVVSADPPTGSVIVDDGAAYTSLRTVTLTLSASAPITGVAEMRFSNNDSDWSLWEPYASTSVFTLEPGDGAKTVFAQFRDTSGKVSDSCSDTITLETVAPSGSITINSGAVFTNANGVSLAPVASDNLSGVAKMRFSNDALTWSAWQPYMASTAWTLSFGDGLKRVYVQFQDNAGNISDDFESSITLETQPPTGSVAIDDGAEFVTSQQVDVSLTAEDNLSNVTSMRLRNENTTWSQWMPFAQSKAWTLSTGNGAKSVEAQFRDAAGNISSTYSDAVTLDSSPPTGTIAINSGESYTSSYFVTLSFDAPDAESVQVAAPGGAWSGWSPADEVIAWELPEGYGLKTVQARFQDPAGNQSDITSDTIVVDTIPPTASVRVNFGAAYTSSPEVTLALAASDAGSGVAWMRARTVDTPWGEWETYQPRKKANIGYGDGEKTVLVELMDRAGNVSETFSDSIFLDAAGSTGGIIVNGGSAYTSAGSVVLDLTSPDAASVRLANDDGDFGPWLGFVPSIGWTLSTEDGPKTVRAEFRDSLGNVSLTYSDSIVLDTTPPSSAVTINAGVAATSSSIVTLSVTAGDELSGVESVRVGNSADSLGDWMPYVATYGWTLLPGIGARTVYAQARDRAGNLSPIASDAIIVDSNAFAVIATDPMHLGVGVPVNTRLRVLFSKPVDESTLTVSAITLVDESGAALPGIVSYDPATISAAFAPSDPLAVGAVYTATISGAVRDTSGTALGADCSWTFTTSAVESDDFYEPNNSPTEAYDLSASDGVWISDVAGPATQADEDYYAITVPDRRLTVMVDCLFHNADGNMDVELLGPDGSQVFASSASASDWEHLEVTVPASGLYLIRVTGQGRGNAYNLRWSSHIGGDTGTPGDFNGDSVVSISDATAFIQAWVRWHTPPLVTFNPDIDQAFDLAPRTIGQWPDWRPIGDEAINIQDATAFIECWIASHPPTEQSVARGCVTASRVSLVQTPAGIEVIVRDTGASVFEVAVPLDPNVTWDTSPDYSGNVRCVRKGPGAGNLFFAEFDRLRGVVRITGRLAGSAPYVVAVVVPYFLPR